MYVILFDVIPIFMLFCIKYVSVNCHSASNKPFALKVCKIEQLYNLPQAHSGMILGKCMMVA